MSCFGVAFPEPHHHHKIPKMIFCDAFRRHFMHGQTNNINKPTSGSLFYYHLHLAFFTLYSILNIISHPSIIHALILLLSFPLFGYSPELSLSHTDGNQGCFQSFAVCS